MSGEMKSATRRVTTVVKAAPMTMPTARSTTLPRSRNARKPFTSRRLRGGDHLAAMATASFPPSTMTSLPRYLVGQHRNGHRVTGRPRDQSQELIQDVRAGAVHG